MRIQLSDVQIMSIHPASSPTSIFRIYRNEAGRWCARKGDGLVAGTFFDHESALRFAKRESYGTQLQCLEDDLVSWPSSIGRRSSATT
jgi:hypothetical protein